ncbi:DnaJ domain protein [Aspergillus brunneoviolaceus CBS 621.78]|uniref:Uncharacterized protein n=1 Tax=Aspergillus brunneoviolaceus CBS 621.78 TaxID=1450534 RepID=A0ACD1GC94_9EURO|nr:hypothetical protein BO95DRAFT_481329 [Aspergillus brunneoviolaceus CBS 621.78]RAH46832.1 hypothetical protein BO95DRAFT_481329 [Aspergillus brunneoviolaceus CBS 621.78]
MTHGSSPHFRRTGAADFRPPQQPLHPYHSTVQTQRITIFLAPQLSLSDWLDSTRNSYIVTCTDHRELREMSHSRLRAAASSFIHRQCRYNNPRPQPRTASAASSSPFAHIHTSHPRLHPYKNVSTSQQQQQTSSFSTTTHHHASAREPTYYEVLDIPITASQGEIKKCVALRCVALRCVALRCVALRCVAFPPPLIPSPPKPHSTYPDPKSNQKSRKFYTLSMRHHPDRNRDDPTASSRFARISSAYNVLSQPNKRAAYDRDHGIYAQYQNTRSTATAGQHPMGSYSSHGGGANLHTKGSSYAGSRPASGLSNRRGQFRGPPPSFYAHGGYGRTGRTNPGPGSTGGGGSDAAGQSSTTTNDEDPTAFIHRNTVHHFNAKGHYKTQSAEDVRRKERRQKAMEAALKEQYIGSPWGAAMRFAAVCGILVGAATVAGLFQWPREKVSKQKDQLR